IIGYSEMILEDSELSMAREVADDLRKILHSGSHLLALINNILDLSKIEAGKMELWAESFNVQAMIDGVMATAGPLLAKNNNRVAVACPRDVGQMHSDLLKIRQVLLNLLSNAGKFTHNGEVAVVVERVPAAPSDVIEIAVRDTGIGIADENQEQLFEDFAQADPTTAREFGGTGLGLALSRRFCRLMGGELSLESELGAGSTFTVRLPVRAPERSPDNLEVDVAVQAVARARDRSPEPEPALEPEADAKVDAPPPVARERVERARATSGVLGGPSQRDTVLVIDDDPAVLDMMIRFLTREGWDVIAASSPASSIALARAVRPTAITLDVLMPEADGWEVLAALKASPILADIPVIMLSITDDQQRGLRLGAADFLLKPIERERLIDVLGRHRDGERPPKVLVIDDDANARGLARGYLERDGWVVNEACDGLDGFDCLAKERPDVILLDLIMPRCDGFRFLERLRASPAQGIPVVVLTGKDLTAEERRFLANEAEEVLGKTNASPEALLDELRRWLGGVRRAEASA
ncbi:MAG: response regulator, partial [Myxococcales bacterium]|nr:response regulator [Myxococcales bacterium]